MARLTAPPTGVGAQEARPAEGTFTGLKVRRRVAGPPRRQGPREGIKVKPPRAVTGRACRDAVERGPAPMGRRPRALRVRTPGPPSPSAHARPAPRKVTPRRRRAPLRRPRARDNPAQGAPVRRPDARAARALITLPPPSLRHPRRRVATVRGPPPCCGGVRVGGERRVKAAIARPDALETDGHTVVARPIAVAVACFRKGPPEPIVLRAGPPPPRDQLNAQPTRLTRDPRGSRVLIAGFYARPRKPRLTGEPKAPLGARKAAMEEIMLTKASPKGPARPRLAPPLLRPVVAPRALGVGPRPAPAPGPLRALIRPPGPRMARDGSRQDPPRRDAMAAGATP